MAACCIKGCEKKVLARGMCSMHYSRLRKYGDPTKGETKQLLGATLQERFDHYTDKTAGSGCWIWTGSRDANGYGRLNVANSPVLAHRISWQLHRHEITTEQQVLHRCDNPPCVNPGHLFIGDPSANVADMIAKGRDRKRGLKGEDHAQARLTEDQVREIRASTGPSRITAEQYGISGRQVREIRAGTSWKHLT